MLKPAWVEKISNPLKAWLGKSQTSPIRGKIHEKTCPIVNPSSRALGKFLEFFLFDYSAGKIFKSNTHKLRKGNIIRMLQFKMLFIPRLAPAAQPGAEKLRLESVKINILLTISWRTEFLRSHINP